MSNSYVYVLYALHASDGARSAIMAFLSKEHAEEHVAKISDHTRKLLDMSGFSIEALRVGDMNDDA